MHISSYTCIVLYNIQRPAFFLSEVFLLLSAPFPQRYQYTHAFLFIKFSALWSFTQILNVQIPTLTKHSQKYAHILFIEMCKCLYAYTHAQIYHSFEIHFGHIMQITLKLVFIWHISQNTHTHSRRTFLFGHATRHTATSPLSQQITRAHSGHRTFALCIYLLYFSQ